MNSKNTNYWQLAVEESGKVEAVAEADLANHTTFEVHMSRCDEKVLSQAAMATYRAN